MSIQQALSIILPGARIVERRGTVLTIETNATGKQIFEAEKTLRQGTGIMYELMCGRMQDQNKLRIKLAKFRGIGDAT